MATVTPLRPSPIAGTWYEARPEALARAVDSYIDQAELPKLEGELIGVVAPHAGHRYSGPVAGYAFAAVRGLTPELVAVISPMHQPHNGSLLTTAHAAYATPLGSVPVDEQAVHTLESQLKLSLGLGLTPVAYDQEHSLEIELPFLQRALAGPFSLLPVMVRTVTPRFCRALGSALAETLLGRKFLLVASTDLSHYFTQKVAEAMDSEMLDRLGAFDPHGLFDAEAAGRGQACGLGALTAVLWAARDLGADTVKVLHHATSGDVTGDYSAVVGYGAAAILRHHP
jgi:AmmeMemoRadiSam system protein B